MLTQNIARKFIDLMNHIEYGSLELIMPDGRTHNFSGRQPGPNCHFHVHAWDVITRMSLKGEVGLIESYREGKWATRNIADLTRFGAKNAQALGRFFMGNPFFNAIANLAYKLRLNTLKGSKRNIHAHYDLGNDFYGLWLDPTMTYSSAIFKNDNESLESAQNNKYDRILDCLGEHSGDILEVGCGWGGFANRAVTLRDHRIKGITISEQQYAYAKNRLKGMPADISFEDYRHQKNKYDFIVSIEMFEAVGEKYWPVYFEKISSLLKSGGKAVIQTITIDDDLFDNYRKGTDYIRSYIFPGGMLPSKNVFKQQAEKAGLKISDQYAFGYDYAKTLSLWLDEFDAHKSDLPALGFDESFVRLWRFYLAGCIAGFETERTDVMQVELQHA
jgi:cyclopropane-fatty-acyl-phospholipid synthase